jgi:ribosomal protein L40E
MRCSKCGTDNPQGMSFCDKCGTPLKNTCAKCGFENPLDFGFCGRCGTALNAAAARGEAVPANRSSRSSTAPLGESRVAEAREEVEGERKTVTALFADIKGSTELEQDLDPEEARAIIDPALKLMIDAVRQSKPRRRACGPHAVESSGTRLGKLQELRTGDSFYPPTIYSRRDRAMAITFESTIPAGLHLHAAIPRLA